MTVKGNEKDPNNDVHISKILGSGVFETAMKDKKILKKISQDITGSKKPSKLSDIVRDKK